MILSVQKCPAMIMIWDLGLVTIPLRILKEKLLLYHHMSCLPDSALAKKIMMTQERLNYPSLKNEISHFLSKYEVVNVNSFSKATWRNLVRKKITEMNRNYLIEWSRSYKKLDYLSLANEEFGLKEYFTILGLDQARLKFRERAKCIKTCKVHFPSDWRNIKQCLNVSIVMKSILVLVTG